MIPGSSILLERCLMLFVNYDQAELRRGGEHGAARSHDDLHLSRRDLLPMPMPLGVAQMTVQDGDRIESGPKSADRLRRETDLGNEHDGLAAVTYHFLNRADVDFGLAAPRHAE